MRRTITFERIERRRELSGWCTQCSKRFRRIFKIWHSINPYNRDEHGRMKSREQVAADVLKAITDLETAFLQEPCCTKCRTQTKYEELSEQMLAARTAAGKP